ncbi:MAG: cell wall-active antibiotics response protein LiaF [Bacillota bacterium]
MKVIDLNTSNGIESYLRTIENPSPGPLPVLKAMITLNQQRRKEFNRRELKGKEVGTMKQRIWGFILLVLGVLVFLQVTGIYNFGLAFWPVILLFLGIAILWESIGFGVTSWFLIGLGLWVSGIGLFGILSNAGATELTGGDLARYGWPIVLVAIGLSILIGDRPRIKGRFFCGRDDKDRASYAKMRHIGDLYHGRAPWVLDQDYDFYHGIGDVVIDLTTAEIRPGTHKIFLKTGIGEVTIRIPDKVNIDVEASVGIGELDLFGESRSGFAGFSLSRKVEVEGAEATLQIEARLGIGDLKVQYLPAISGEIR